MQSLEYVFNALTLKQTLTLSCSLGHVLSSSDHIREVHNSFSKSSPFSMDPSAFPEREKEDAYHFVAYLPINDILYELDGLRRFPIMHAPVEGDWLDTVRETIEQRIATYPAGSVSLIHDSSML